MIWVNYVILLSWSFGDGSVMIWIAFNLFGKNTDILNINENKFSEVYRIFRYFNYVYEKTGFGWEAIFQE